MRNITGSQITYFITSTFKQCILTINQYKDWSFNRICKVHLSDENKMLMDKSMFERYRKYKCCVFIDFEYIKQGFQKYCKTAYSRSGINQMWILKNSKELLEHLKSPFFNHVTSIKPFDISTIYTTIPHQKLKDRLTSIIRNAFIFKNGNRRYKYLVLGHEETYFCEGTLWF